MQGNPCGSFSMADHLDLSYTCQLFSSFCEKLGFSWHHEKTGEELRLLSLPFSNICTSALIDLNNKKK